MGSATRMKDAAVMRQVSRRLSQTIEARGETVISTSRKAGIGKTSLYRWLSDESAQVPFPHMAAVAFALGVSLDWLVGAPGSEESFGDRRVRVTRALYALSCACEALVEVRKAHIARRWHIFEERVQEVQREIAEATRELEGVEVESEG